MPEVATGSGLYTVNRLDTWWQNASKLLEFYMIRGTARLKR